MALEHKAEGLILNTAQVMGIYWSFLDKEGDLKAINLEDIYGDSASWDEGRKGGVEPDEEAVFV